MNLKPIVKTEVVESPCQGSSNEDSLSSAVDSSDVDEQNDNDDDTSNSSQEQEDNSYHNQISSSSSSSSSLFLSWISSMAILGDSGISLMFTFGLLVISIWIALFYDDSAGNNEKDDSNIYFKYDTYESLGPIPEMVVSYPKIYNVSINNEVSSQIINITDEMRIEYERDGVICIRGLISDDLLERLDKETSIFINEQKYKDGNRRRKGNTQFYTAVHSPLITNATINTSITNSDTDDEIIQTTTTTTPSALMEVALWSPIPAVIAILLNITNDDDDNDNNSNTKTETLRVIRDIFLAKDDDEYVCGWHVDDLGFWPAIPESPGINAWIALDDMENSNNETGGFALAIQSHTALWKDAAYYWTGAAAYNFPNNGYTNVTDMLNKRTGLGTCNIKNAASHIHQRMEETKRIYPVKRGDVIFHTRWLFHRTVPITNHKQENINNNDNKIFRRYSIRYGPGSTSIIPPGYGTELSVLWNEQNGGKTADEINYDDGPWYPQAWPPMTESNSDEISNFWKNMNILRNEKLPIAQQRKELRIQEMKPYLKRMAKEQQQKQLQRKK